MDMENTNAENLSKKERRELKRQTKLTDRAAQARKKTARAAAIWLAVLGGLALAVFGLIKLGSPKGNIASTPAGELPPIAADDWVYGSPLAAHTLVEYSDFQCPACAAAEPFVR